MAGERTAQPFVYNKEKLWKDDIVIPCTNSPEHFHYDISKPGQLAIFNFNFKNHSTEKERVGTEKDVHELKECFTGLGFDVFDVFDDYTYEKVEIKLKERK